MNLPLSAQAAAPRPPPARAPTLRDALEQSGSFLLLLDTEGRVVDCNAALPAAAGLPGFALQGRALAAAPWWEPEAAACLAEDVALAREGAATHRAALAFRGAGGARRHAELGLSPVRDASGRVTGLLADGRDVTDRVAAEEALATERARIDAILENLPVGLMVAEAGTGRLLRTGPRNADMRGAAPASMDLAASLAAFPRRRADTGAPYTVEDLPIARALRGEVVRGERFRMRDATGRWHAFLAHATPLRDAEGRITAAIATATDVTGQEALATRLAESEARLQQAVETAAIGLVEWDLRRGALRLDARAAEILGGWMPAGAWLAMEGPERAAWRGAIHPEDLPERDAIRAALAAGTVAGRLAQDYRFRARDGSGWRWISTTGAVLERDAAGRPLRLLDVLLDVTDRREASASLAEREAMLRRVQAIGRVGGFEIDLRTGINSRSAEYMGLQGHAARMAEERHEDWVRRLHPEDRERAERRFLDAVSDASGATEYAQDYRIVTPRGEVRWISARAEIEREPVTGRALRMLGAHVDITGLRQAEAALQEALSELAAVYDSAPVGLCVLDRDLRWVRINARLAEINGLPPEAHLGRTVREVLPALAESAEPALRRVLETGEPLLRVELRGETPAQPGVMRFWEESFLPIRDAAGRVTGINVVAEEVTERRAAQRALEESEGRFRALAEAVPALVWEAAPDGSIAWIGPGWTAFTGLPVEAALGRGWVSVIHPDDREASLDAWRKALATGRPYEMEHRLRHREGHWRWLLARAVPQPAGAGAAGAARGWLGTSTDIEELVRAREGFARVNAELEALVERRTAALRDTVRRLEEEQRLREADQAALVQAQKLEAMGQLVGGVAHDFNNLLMAISGSFQLLERRLPASRPGEPAAEVLRQGREAAGRAGALVRQLLAFARREMLRPAALDPAALAEPLAALLRPAMGPRIAVSVEVAPGTWPVLADRQQLEVALLNLALNARDAMPEGGSLTLGIGNRCEGGEAGAEMVGFAVADTGEGMPPEVLARAREPFFTTKPLGKGTGLGLAMVHGFAGQSGGTLRLESEAGRGTRATILLPRLTEAGAALLGPAAGGEEAAAAAAARLLDRARHGDATILLVEDDAVVRPVTAAFLRDLGYAVLEAGDADAAYARVAAADGAIDLVVTDVMMPGEHGPALAERLHAEWPGLPMLFVTGHADQGLLRGIAPARVLLKPFTQEALAARLLALLGREA